MKTIWNLNRRIFIAWLFLLAQVVAAQTQPQSSTASSSSETPVRLAIIAQSGNAANVADLLTASLSANPKIQLLERDEINKIQREQSLAAANKDYLKLGQVLGADGLMLLDVIETPSASNPPDSPQFFKKSIEAYWHHSPMPGSLPVRMVRQNTNSIFQLSQPGFTNMHNP